MVQGLASRQPDMIPAQHWYQHTKSEEIALNVTNVEFKSDIFITEYSSLRDFGP